MVTAILPSLTNEEDPTVVEEAPKPPHNPRQSVTPSVDSEVTITPERFRSVRGSNGVDYTAGSEADGRSRGSLPDQYENHIGIVLFSY